MTEPGGAAPTGPTPSQTIGPFFHDGLLGAGGDHVVPAGHPHALVLHGQVLDGAGEPCPDAMVEVWQLDPDGLTRQESSLDGFTGAGRVATDQDGRYRVRVLAPPPTTTQDGRAQAPHFDVVVHARGLLRHLVTRAYVLPTDTALARAAADRDPVLSTLDPERRRRLTAGRGSRELRFDIHLQGEHETPFFAV